VRFVWLLIACAHPQTAVPAHAVSACGGDPVAKEAPLRRSELASELEGLPIVKIEGGEAPGIKVGDPLSRDAIARAIRAIYARGDAEEIQVSAEQDGAGVAVFFLVVLRPRVNEIEAPGIPDATREDIAKALGIVRGKALDPAELWARERVVAEGMHARGTSFDVRTLPTRSGKIDVCILVGK